MKNNYIKKMQIRQRINRVIYRGCGLDRLVVMNDDGANSGRINKAYFPG